MSNTALINETKKVMEYVEHAPVCVNCAYYYETEVDDRFWLSMCKYSEIAHFQVSESGCCKKFKLK